MVNEPFNCRSEFPYRLASNPVLSEVEGFMLGILFSRRRSGDDYRVSSIEHLASSILITCLPDIPSCLSVFVVMINYAKQSQFS
jgi:hypothetical protein